MAKNKIVTKQEIDAYPAEKRHHFLDKDAIRFTKSLGDMAGLTGFGFHIAEVPAGHLSTEPHFHHYEEECVYILEGQGISIIGEDKQEVQAGDFIGYPAGGEAHSLLNTGDVPLKCIVVGQRLAHDICDYPEKNKRVYRMTGMPRALVDLDDIKVP